MSRLSFCSRWTPGQHPEADDTTFLSSQPLARAPDDLMDSQVEGPTADGDGLGKRPRDFVECHVAHDSTDLGQMLASPAGWIDYRCRARWR